MHSPFLAQKSNQNTFFLLPWIFPWFFIGFLLSLSSYAQSVLRKPSFLVLADFFSLFLKNQATAWSSWSCLHPK
jgi:hypothetical protein